VTDASLTIGVDIGGTKVLGGVVDEAGTVLATARRDTPADDVTKTLDQIVDVVAELATLHPVKAVGLGAAGWFDTDRNRVLFAPNLAWRNEPLRDRLSERIRLPVMVENDGNVAAWAEFRFGAARDATDSMALFTVGTGIGGGLVLGGELVRGAHGIAAEMGHARVMPGGHLCGCGRLGCLEQYASGSALVRYARDAATADPGSAGLLLVYAGGSVEAITGPLVTRAAQEGDAASVAAFAEVGRWLGSALADMVAILDPEVLVVGGGVIEAAELLLGPTRTAYQREMAVRGTLPAPAVVAAQLGPMAGVVGAADLARH
jgi:glucokinase